MGMADPEKAEKFQKFLINYSLDMILVILAVFWHIGFLSAMGLVVAYMIYNEMKTLGDGDVNVDIDVAWKMMFFGTLMGAVNYLAGVAVSVNDDTIIKMLGFTPYKDEDEETTKTIEETASSGTFTTTQTITTITKYPKDLFGLMEMQENWGTVFMLQKTLQATLPFLYLGMLETAVGMVFGLLLLFVDFS